MNASQYRDRAAARTARAEELEDVARHLQTQVDALAVWFAPVGTHLLPQVWAGPAADRATDGYWQARRQAAAALATIADRITAIRAQATALEDDAADDIRKAQDLEAAAAEAARLAAQPQPVSTASGDGCNTTGFDRRMVA